MSVTSDESRPPGGAELLRAVGLLPDGPAVWGSPIRADGPGVYIVELPSPIARAPIDISAIGTWLERVPALRLDGRRPTGKELAARIASFWLPDQTVLYVGMTTSSVGRRVAAYYRTPLGDPKPHAGGHWLRTLSGYERCRIWWAVTDAPEEYEDALLGEFARHVDPAAAAALHDPSLVLPFANRQSATDVRRADGISGSTIPAEGFTPRQAPVGSEASPSVRRSSPVGPRGSIEAINAALQEIACGRLAQEIGLADASAELAARGLLRERPGQPGGVLRELCRAGVIEHAVQDADRRWSIRCGRPAGP